MAHRYVKMNSTYTSYNTEHGTHQYYQGMVWFGIVYLHVALLTRKEDAIFVAPSLTSSTTTL
jgi:hypothetical protein